MFHIISAPWEAWEAKAARFRAPLELLILLLLVCWHANSIASIARRCASGWLGQFDDARWSVLVRNLRSQKSRWYLLLVLVSSHVGGPLRTA